MARRVWPEGRWRRRAWPRSELRLQTPLKFTSTHVPVDLSAHKQKYEPKTSLLQGASFRWKADGCPPGMVESCDSSCCVYDMIVKTKFQEA